MNTEKKLGIWMSNSKAILMELANDTIIEKIVTLDFTKEEKGHSQEKGEQFLHNKEQAHQSAYYKKIGELIRNYKHVFLFGPGNAKSELHNLLKKDHLFENIKVDTKNADQMNTEQMHDFVRTFFK